MTITLSVVVIPIVLSLICVLIGYLTSQGDWDFVTPMVAIIGILFVWMIYFAVT